MFNERAFIAEVEGAGPTEFARIMERPDGDQETALRRHFGDERFDRLHRLAEKQETRRAAKRGNVVVIHGIMGGELTVFERNGAGDRIWIHLLRLLGGAFDRLKLDDAGDGPANPRWDARPSGIYKKDYGEQLLTLSADWNVRAFWYDWRRDLNKAADMLNAQIGDWFGPHAPVHLVAHSMGGLVARAFIARHGARWRGMWDSADAGKAGGRLLMLGTPNHGSFAVPQILTGLEGMLRKLAAADLTHSAEEIRAIAATFLGSYQMMPSPLIMPEVEPLYRAETYGDRLRIPQRHLDAGRAFHEAMRDVVDPDRMIYVAGYNQPTLGGITDMRVGDRNAYQVTNAGDKRVPHRLGLLEGVPHYFIEEGHGKLPQNAKVLSATTELLETGQTGRLGKTMPALRGVARAASALRDLHANEEAEIARIREASERLQRLRAAPHSAPISDDERVIAELIMDGWLGGAGTDDGSGIDAYAPETEPRVAPEPARIDVGGVDAIGGQQAKKRKGARAASAEPVKVRVRVICGKIEEAEKIVDGEPAVDVIAVGHYVGVRPQNAERALDEAVSRALLGRAAPKTLLEGQLLLTEYTERGTLRGELGQPFIIPDPRGGDRIIVIEGMGLPGRFGTAELSVLARELAWTVGRLGRKHVATVLIGSGVGAVRTSDAVAAWMRGLHEALVGSGDDGVNRVDCLTFVEFNPQRVVEIDRALRAQDSLFEQQASVTSQPWLDIVYEPLAAATVQSLKETAADEACKNARASILKDNGEQLTPEEPTRVIISLAREGDQTTYRIGAITQSAAVAERAITLDSRLIERPNDELPALRTVAEQARKGNFLEQLLLRDVRAEMSTRAPLVLVLDSSTARIHWEMLAQPRAGGGGEGPLLNEGFLGTCRGVTRQLRTAFAPIPEPPPPAQRPLRVLIVADPASDAPLRGAAAEGSDIYELFQKFNKLRSGRTVEPTLLRGPNQARADAVLDVLFSQSFDVLHFAGHCTYDAKDPTASGWIFSDGLRLSANELRRVDRVPKFVFSNACESGITPDRSDRRTAALAPSFAEAFFERGVGNFVCTAWPVGDKAARAFALHLYAALLGIGSEENPLADESRDPQPMHVAMHQARRALMHLAEQVSRDEFVTTWGAYQHYGSPTFRFFYPPDLTDGAAART